MTHARAFPIVIAAPSGAGKTSLAQELVRRHDDVVFSISATTRAPRLGERDGIDYFFIDETEFTRLIEADELVEWATVHGCRYGTLRREVAAAFALGRTVVLDIDVQGARQVRQRMPEAVLAFVLPPSGAELIRRLEGRATESAAQRASRLAAAAGELSALEEFDYVVVNDDFDAAVAALEAIITAESCRVARHAGLRQTAAELAAELRQLIQRSR
ncbi:MAG: guanylate kinase [Gemmatimonadetes bacterium]|nr:guanylate kinase [Gemmatimonadota bacterium]